MTKRKGQNAAPSLVPTRAASNERARRAPKPVYRRLRGYAFDPSLSVQLETAVINEIVYKVDWEEASERSDDGLQPGPVGEYLEIVDYDPASGCFYAPVDLDDPHVLAQDGLPPSEGDPQFHQQMVYAVAMTTIRNFERALGRRALWAERVLWAEHARRDGAPGAEGVADEGAGDEAFVRRLRVYPHALREANAYYSPEKKALLFGYFPATEDRPGQHLPGGLVFTCLSHDIVAHETTHALLDGMHRRFVEANHPDALAFHEAFADIVALFQHFSFPNVLRHQIARTRGDLASQNLLGELAQQFGQAIGNYGALRSAIGAKDGSGAWKPLEARPEDYRTTTEPHARGAILVAAVFDAFLGIYKSRVADLLRIASNGTGVLPEGAIPPDLVDRLASEAAKSSQHVLNVCIRALDYCPPVDVSFGDYLRAIITADVDCVPDDDKGYRIAFIEAFRRRGIYPRDVRTLSVESLRWPAVDDDVRGFFEPLREKLRSYADLFRYFEDRRELHEETRKLRGRLHEWIEDEGHAPLREFGREVGVAFEEGELAGLRMGSRRPGKPASSVPRFEIHSLRPARRVGPDGDSLNQLILSIVQTRDVPLDPEGARGSPKIAFRGGCTLILDLDTMRLVYAIKKDIADEARLARHRAYRTDLLEDGSLRATYFAQLRRADEPFALLHRSFDHGERPDAD